MEDIKAKGLPPPPPNAPKAIQRQRVPMARQGLGTKGQRIPLLTNHFKVSIGNTDGHFYHYSVAFTQEDGYPADQKGIGRRVMDKVQVTYAADLDGKNFAYDGEKSLFTLGSLPNKKLDFIVVLDDLGSTIAGNEGSPSSGDHKRVKRQYGSKTIKVDITFAAKIPLQSIAAALRGQQSDHFQEAVRVLDIILRQNAAKQGCLLVRQSFFHNIPRNFDEVGGGVLSCKGFHSSFRATQGGLSLNMDLSTTMVVKPGPVIDFLLMNQDVRHPRDIDWNKAKKTLKNLRIKVETTNQGYKISGLSEKPCRDQFFSMKQKNGSGGNETATIEVTVYDYFVNHRRLPLQYSADFPCINVGKSKRPTYFPIELCSLVSLQRYTRALSSQQRAALVEKSRQKPRERMRALENALAASKYNDDSILCAAGISISSQFTQVDGRVLPTPKLKVGNGMDLFPRNGRWNFNNKTLVTPTKIERWSVVIFSARCDVNNLMRTMRNCAAAKGLPIDAPDDVFEEEPGFKRAPPQVRVEKMFERIKQKYAQRPPLFLLCILPERKNSDIYGPWKLKNLSEFGIVTQCIAPTKINDQYMTNVLLKINAKLGGLNSVLAIEHAPSMPLISKQPTVILGMDVSHGSPGRADVPSVAAVVGSRQWPLISRYRASVRTQSPKVEMIASLFKPSNKSETEKQDDGLIRELLVDFYRSSGQRKPEQIVIFRDGVSESQFNQVLNVELDQIMQACRFLDEQWFPKFVLIIAQKNHHTKFFQVQSPDNVPPGTIVDTHVGHPKGHDFYMCAHAGMIGTTRPTHYHVLYDEVGFSPDDLQELVHSLSYVYQRSTTAISVVAPICYAHLAAAQVSQFIKFDEMSETSSSHGGTTSSGGIPVPELPKLHDRVCNSMFFC